MNQFAIPLPEPAQLFVYFRKRPGKNGGQEVVTAPSDRLLFRPSVQSLGAAIPELNRILVIHYQDRVVCDVEQLSKVIGSLLGSLVH